MVRPEQIKEAVQSVRPWAVINTAGFALAELAEDDPELCQRLHVAGRFQTCSPTYVPHLVDTCLDLLIDGASARWHLANLGGESWYGLAMRAAASARLPCERILSLQRGTDTRAPRPSYSVLRSNHGSFMPTLEEAMLRYTREMPDNLGASRAA